MTAFEAIFFGIIYGITLFLPVSFDAHEYLFPELINWSAPTPTFSFILFLSATLALFIYYIHDWASIISSFLKVIFTWKKPQTIDEVLPFFILLTTVPVVLAYHYLTIPIEVNMINVSIGLITMSVITAFVSKRNRKKKGTFDWSIVDSLVLGVFQILSLIPGVGRNISIFAAGFIRNYQWEALAKYSYLTLLPLLVIKTISYYPQSDFTQFNGFAAWIPVVICFVVCFFSGILSIGGFLKAIHLKKISSYYAYRVILALGTLAYYFIQVA